MNYRRAGRVMRLGSRFLSGAAGRPRGMGLARGCYRSRSAKGVDYSINVYSRYNLEGLRTGALPIVSTPKCSAPSILDGVSGIRLRD